jgi:tetratricopeptide (TPR) repeat protein
LEAALDTRIEGHFRQGWEALLAETYLALGDVDRADSLASASLEHAPGGGYPADAIQCRRVLAMARAAQARWDESDTCFERALAEADDFPFVQAHVHHHVGCSLLRRDEADAARAHLGAAFTLFTRVGAAIYAERTGQVLERLQPST